MRQLFLTVFFLFVIYAAFTNPDKREFATHLAHQQIEKTDDILGKGIIKALKRYTDEVIEGNTEDLNDIITRKNYIVFSKFEVELPLRLDPLIYVGALHFFVQLPSDSRTSRE